MANEPGIEKIKGIFDGQGITMAGSRKQKRKGMTLKSLEARLRCLSQVEVPETLKAKLFAAIPEREQKATPQYQVPCRRRVWRFGAAAAAAVLIFGLLFSINYGLSVPSQVLFTELNDTSLCYTRWNQSNFLYDQNNTCIEKSLPFDLKWPVINQNGPGY